MTDEKNRTHGAPVKLDVLGLRAVDAATAEARRKRVLNAVRWTREMLLAAMEDVDGYGDTKVRSAIWRAITELSEAREAIETPVDCSGLDLDAVLDKMDCQLTARAYVGAALATNARWIAAAIRDGRHLEAIRRIRKVTGCGLRDGKNAMIDIAEQLGFPTAPLRRTE